MKDLVPLIQTLLWIGLILSFLAVLRPEITLLRHIIVKRIEEGTSFELGPIKIGQLQAEVRAVREDLEHVSDKVADLFLLTMAPAMYLNLRKLASGDFGLYEMNEGLERELYHLRDIGYITVESIKSIPNTGTNLSYLVQVTPAGKQFVELREAVQAQYRITTSSGPSADAAVR